MDASKWFLLSSFIPVAVFLLLARSERKHWKKVRDRKDNSTRPYSPADTHRPA